MYVCFSWMYICIPPVFRAHRSPKRVSGSQELWLQMVLNHTVWWEIKPGSHGRPANAPNCWAIAKILTGYTMWALGYTSTRGRSQLWALERWVVADLGLEIRVERRRSRITGRWSSCPAVQSGIWTAALAPASHIWDHLYLVALISNHSNQDNGFSAANTIQLYTEILSELKYWTLTLHNHMLRLRWFEITSFC